MELITLNNYILVEKLQTSENSPTAFFKDLSLANNKGKVLVCNQFPELLGKSVYHGNQYEKVIIEGKEFLAMKIENIIAKLEETNG